MKRVIAMVSLALLFSAYPVFAGDSNVCTWAEAKTWGTSAPGKLTRGILNTGLGWTNIFVQPFKESPVISGIGKGLGFFAVRTVQGLGELFLFWLPPVPNEPLRECVFYDWGLIDR